MIAVTSEKITNYQRIIQTILINYHHKSHSKQCFQTTSNNSQYLLSEKSSKQFLQTIITEIIPNNSYKLLPKKSFQTILTNFYPRSHSEQCFQTISNHSQYVLSEKSFQTILTNYYHRNNFKQFLQTITNEIIAKNVQSL